jgi:hypothetical protein
VVGTAFLQLEAAAKETGLTVNCEKTKGMVQSRRRTRYGHALSVGCYNFEIVQEFKYLDLVITEDNNEMTEIHQRIVVANRAYFALKDVMKSANVHRKTKVSLYKTVIRIVLCFGSETWTMTGGAEVALAAFERKILRKIFRPVCINGSLRLHYNEELCSIYKSADVITHIKLRRLEWAGHVHWMQSSRIVEGRILGGKPVGRPHRR